MLKELSSLSPHGVSGGQEQHQPHGTRSNPYVLLHFMVGYLRFVLATLVLLSHLNLRVFGCNPGVFAVVIFYMLAGWVLSRLWYDILSQEPGRFRRLVLDRFLRIYPLYAYVCVLSLLFLWLSGYGHPRFGLLSLLGNALIVPLNYYMWINTEILTQPRWCLIPPAWSLGTEVQAYLALTIIFLKPQLKSVLLGCSIGIYLLAGYAVIHSEWYGYRLLPGVFFIFGLGHCLQRVQARKADLFDQYFPVIAWLIAAFLVVRFFLMHHHYIPYLIETSVGILFGVPVVVYAHRFRRRLPGDHVFGALSYGVFLSHFLVIWALAWMGMPEKGTGGWSVTQAALVMVGSVCIAGIGVQYFETPFTRWRMQKKWRE